MSKLVVSAVLVLAAVATADAFRASPTERALSASASRDLVAHRAYSEFAAVGAPMRTRVVR